MARALLILLASAGLARADRPELGQAALEERDALLDKIAQGVDYEASVRRFAALVRERDQLVATSAAAQEQQRQQHEQERAQQEAKRKWMDEYRKTGDYEVSWRCTLAVDPANPPPSKEGRFKPDWGPVVRKETIRFAPKNALDDGEQATMYEVKGRAGTYTFRGDNFHPRKGSFEAERGDQVLVCSGSEDTDRRLPPHWGPRVLRSGFAVRLAAPPLIVKKARWNPIHITGSVFFWAIKDVQWRFPPEAFVLSNIVVEKDLGGGRYEIEADRHRDMSWVLEVPPQVKNRDLLQPGRAAWVIMGNHRFDRGLKKLVLVAEDIEARYITEK